MSDEGFEIYNSDQAKPGYHNHGLTNYHGIVTGYVTRIDSKALFLSNQQRVCLLSISLTYYTYLYHYCRYLSTTIGLSSCSNIQLLLSNRLRILTYYNK